MSKIDLSKTLLLRNFFVLILKNYGNKLNQKNLFYGHKIFNFFEEKGLGVFYVAYLGENGNRFYEKKRHKILL